ncbi:MAG: hypothetical protein K2H84_09390 [Paramuribaculum sp.]|nr:hypothetical protein [Paramuribaculum sp.]
MKILLIYGEQDAGKSTVCKRVYCALKSLGAIVERYERFPWGDFKAILVVNGYKIGIYSAGDSKQLILEARQFGEENGCDILIGAVRYHTHYNEIYSDLTCNEHFFWFEFEKGQVTDEEKDLRGFIMGLEILCKVKQIINP